MEEHGRRATCSPRLPVGVDIGEQKPDAQQVDHATVGPHELGLRHPGVAPLVDHAEHGRHIGQLVGRLALVAALVDQQREEASAAGIVIGLRLIIDAEQRELRL